MSTLFDDITARLKEITLEYQVDLGGKFDISTSAITLLAPVPLANVVHFIDTVLDIGDAVPPVAFDGATIEEFEIVREDAKARTPTRAAIELSFSATDWQVMDGLTLGLRMVRLECVGGAWSAKAAASVTIEGAEFDAMVAWPSFVIEGFYAKPPDLDALVGAHGLTVGKAPQLDRLTLFAQPKIHFLEIAVGGTSLIRLGMLELEDADLRLTYRGGPTAAFTGAVHARLGLGGLDFELDGERLETGWTARAVAHGTAPMDRLVGQISQALTGTSHSLTGFGVPPDLAGAVVDGEIALSVDSDKPHASLSVDIALSGGRGSGHFEVAIASDGLSVKARLTLGDLMFEVDFSKDRSAPLLAAQFVSERGVTLGLDALVDLAGISPNASLPTVGAHLGMTVRDVLLSVGSDAKGKPLVLLAADIDGGIDLSGLGDLPLIGPMIPADAALKLSLAPILSNAHWDAKHVKALNDLRGKTGPHLPDTIKGSALGVSLKVPGRAPEPLALDLKADTSGKGDLVSANAGQDDPIKWKTISKNMGPVHIERVGVGLDKSGPAIEVLLDGGFSLGGLSLSLIGLGASYDLPKKDLSFELGGMGLDISKPPLRIAGGFADLDGDFVGKVLVQLKTVSVSASGGFKMIDGAPSMFLYGYLGTPIGGPPFFFVEGLAAGIGVNREIRDVPLSRVKAFPFVADAVAGKADTGDVGAQLTRLHDYILPSLGKYFLAAGIKFTSFKLLESFVLLLISAGSELKIDVLGVSTYQTPPIVAKGLPALARVELNLKASLRPERGTLLVQAELGKNSYVYSSLCHLGGGFAFASWFAGDLAGDFVLSAGGYNPHFKKPGHYPDVGRISLTYQIDPNIYVKGAAYFALTPSLFMAGGSLHAHAQSGSAEADFRMSLDFLIGWEPYHYRADFAVDISAKWHCFHTHAHADLMLIGPPLSGHAHVKWWIFSFNISFGGAVLPFAPPIDWATFQKSFLPHGGTIPAGQHCNIAPSVALTAGRNGQDKAGTIVVNPQEFVLEIDTIVPVMNDSEGVFKGIATPGCGPVGIAAIVSSDLTLTLVRDGAPDTVATHFHATGTPKQFPSAMWGHKLAPGLHDPAHVTAGGSLTLRPQDPKPAKGAALPSILRSAVAYDPSPTLRPQPKLAPTQLQPLKTDPHTALFPQSGTAQATRRDGLLAAVGLEAMTSRVGDSALGTLRTPPHVTERRP